MNRGIGGDDDDAKPAAADSRWLAHAARQSGSAAAQASRQPDRRSLE